MRAADTNILLYVQDPRDPEKQKIAREIIEQLTDGVLLWQVACEYVNAARKFAPFGFDQEQAFRDLQDFRRAWGMLLPSWEVMLTAERLLKSYSLSFWDAVLVAACVEGGVTHLVTEDMGGTPSIEGVRIVNPFAFSSLAGTGAQDRNGASTEKELFDYLAEAEEAVAHMTAVFLEFNEHNLTLNARLEKYNPALDQIVKAGGPRRFSAIKKINLLLASDTNRYSHWFEGVLPGFTEAAIKMNEGYTFYFNNVRLDTEEQRAGLQQERDAIKGLLSTMSTTMQSARFMSQKVEELSGHAKQLTQASRRMVQVFDQFISALTDIESFCLSALAIIDEKMEGRH